MCNKQQKRNIDYASNSCCSPFSINFLSALILTHSSLELSALALCDSALNFIPERLKRNSPSLQCPGRPTQKAGTWMMLETIILSKLSQGPKTKHCMFSLIESFRKVMKFKRGFKGYIKFDKWNCEESTLEVKERVNAQKQENIMSNKMERYYLMERNYLILPKCHKVPEW
ncbi:uncharacterized protein [Symphalangus syndactylus]|uniref:uncharacterized protein n=1 Tax=Symphalangus syndactylus TaxID=9590 RepID=UPI003005DDF0